VVAFFQVSHQNSVCICVMLLEPAKSTDPTQNDGDSDTHLHAGTVMFAVSLSNSKRLTLERLIHYVFNAAML